MNKTITTDKNKQKLEPLELNKLVANNRLIRIKSVIGITSISKSYVYQLVREGKFPKPIQLIKNGKAVAWIESEIQAWVESRIADRDMGAA